MTRNILLLVRQMPYRGSLAREHLELAVVTAVFDQSVSVLFKDDGVWQLHSHAPADQLHAENLLTELENYGIKEIYVCRPSLRARGLLDSPLAIPAQPLCLEDQRALFAAQDTVFSD